MKEDVILMKEKEKAFCQYYAESGNAADAARRAGYAHKSARITGSRLLAKAYISKYLQDLQTKMEADRIADAAETKSVLTALLRDPEVRPGDRIKAAGTLLRAAGEMTGAKGAADPGEDDAADAAAPGRKIRLPWNLNGTLTAVESPTGDVIPLGGVDADEDLLIYLPYDRRLDDILGLSDFFGWERPGDAASENIEVDHL